MRKSKTKASPAQLRQQHAFVFHGRVAACCANVAGLAGDPDINAALQDKLVSAGHRLQEALNLIQKKEAGL